MGVVVSRVPVNWAVADELGLLKSAQKFYARYVKFSRRWHLDAGSIRR